MSSLACRWMRWWAPDRRPWRGSPCASMSTRIGFLIGTAIKVATTFKMLGACALAQEIQLPAAPLPKSSRTEHALRTEFFSRSFPLPYQPSRHGHARPVEPGSPSGWPSVTTPPSGLTWWRSIPGLDDCEYRPHRTRCAHRLGTWIGFVNGSSRLHDTGSVRVNAVHLSPRKSCQALRQLVVRGCQRQTPWARNSRMADSTTASTSSAASSAIVRGSRLSGSSRACNWLSSRDADMYG